MMMDFCLGNICFPFTNSYDLTKNLNYPITVFWAFIQNMTFSWALPPLYSSNSINWVTGIICMYCIGVD